MTIKPLQLLKTVLLLMLLAGLSACATSPTAAPPDSERELGAERAFARGDYTLSAQIWQQEALAAEPGQAGSYRVRAADAWLLDDKPDSQEWWM